MTAAERSLRAALKDRQVIVVAGAGTTLAATRRARTASWAGLLEHGVERVLSDCAPDARRVHAALERLARGTAEDFLVVASMIKRELGHSYPHWLRDAFSSLTVVDGAVPRAVTGLGVPVATTNFDTVFEDVSGWSSATWGQPTTMHSILRGELRGIAHLHGVYTDPDTVVFDAKKYAAVLRTDSAQVLQRVYAVSHSLLFVGVGDGGNDPNIGGLLHWFAEMGWPANPHYWLCLDHEVGDIRDAYPVEAVPYGDGYDDLAPFLRGLVAATPPAPRGTPTVERDDPPAPEPWLVAPAPGSWSALTDGGAMCVLTEEAVGARGVNDIAVVAEGSHLVALDDHGFRVWVLNLDGSLTEWPSAFPFDVAGASIRSARRVDGNAIDVYLQGGHVPRVRLEALRPVVRAVLSDDGTAGGPLRDHATGAFVTLHAALHAGPGGATLSVRREQGTDSAAVTFDTGLAGATRVVVARPLRGRTEPYAVVVEAGGSLVTWRWQDLAAHGAAPRDLAGLR